MRKTFTKGFAFYEDDVTRINSLMEKTGLNGSELIRYMLEKLEQDPVEQLIIINKFLKDEGQTISRERLLRIMSDKSTIKEERAATQRAARSNAGKSVSYQGQFNYTAYIRFCLGLVRKYGSTLAATYIAADMNEKKLPEQTKTSIINTVAKILEGQQ